jgi:hypothetical protein
MFDCSNNEKNSSKIFEMIISGLNIAFGVILLLTGLIGNSFTFFIYSRVNSFKRTSTGFYFSCLSVVNTITLITFVTHILLDSIRDIETIIVNTFTCKFFNFAVYFLSPFSAWIETTAALDRLVAHKFTPFFLNIKRRRYQVFMIGLIFIFLFCLNIPNLIEFDLVYNNESNSSKCEMRTSNSSEIFSLNITDLFLSILIPFSLMLFSSSIVSYRVFKSKVKVVALKNSKLNIMKKEYQFAATIIGRNILFLFLNLPMGVFLILDIECKETNNKPQWYSFAYVLVQFLSYCNYSATFLVDISCNHMFRKRFKQIFDKKTIVTESIKL